MEKEKAKEIFEKWMDCKDAYQADPSCDGKCLSCEYYASAEEEKEAMQMAVSALKKQEEGRWIPVTERLPEDDTEVFVYLFDTKTPYIAWICDGQWYTEEFRVEKQNEPVAWRPLPEPYTEDEA